MTELELPIDMEQETLGGALRRGPSPCRTFSASIRGNPAGLRSCWTICQCDEEGATCYFRRRYRPLRRAKFGTSLTPQRLATACIFLAAARDMFYKLRREKHAESLHDDSCGFMTDLLGRTCRGVALNTE